jgi:hydroxyacylglutathione hydrolase
MIKIEAITAFNDNYIWCLFDDVTRQALVVDPGDADVVIRMLDNNKLQLAGIMITHHHFDHTGGIDGLLALNNVPVYGPISDQTQQITHPLADGATLNLLDLRFEVLTVPGHTLDHIAYFCPHPADQPLLFSGDTLFAGGCGRIFEGTAAMMLASLNKLAALPTSTKIYCAHEYTIANLNFAAVVEPDNEALQERILHDQALRNKNLPTVPSSLANELRTNPFLRSHIPAVAASVQQLDEQDTSPAAVFAAIRAWKDNF